MIENIIKSTQKFINKGFTYDEFYKFYTKQTDLLSNDRVISNTSEREYNAIWHTLGDLEMLFRPLNGLIKSTQSVNTIFNSYNR